MHIVWNIRNVFARGLTCVLVPLCLLLAGCSTLGMSPEPMEVFPLRISPDAVTLGEDQLVVVLSVEPSAGDPDAVPVLAWTVDDAALGRIAISRGLTAVYRREPVAGENRVRVRDQHGNIGEAVIRQTGGDARPAEPAEVSSGNAVFVAGETIVDALEPASGSAARARYTLLVGDEIGLEIFREPDLSGTYRVEHGGEIRHVLLGSIEVAGLTVLQAEARITKLLSERFLVNPRVTVRVLSSQASQVLVMGEVKSPGARQIPFGEQKTLLEVIAAAGGFTDLASVNRVRIIRQEDGRQKQIRVRVGRIVSGTDPDVEIFPNDVITVPQTFF